MRPGEFWEAMKAHQDEVNADRKHIGELIRGATVNLLNIQLDKSHKIDDPAKFWPMPWDEKTDEDEEVRRLDSLNEEQRRKEIQEFFERINGSK